MNNQIFVPVSDDMVYNHPEQIEGPLIPYFAGMECQNWISIEINPEESAQVAELHNTKSANTQTKLRLAYSS